VAVTPAEQGTNIRLVPQNCDTRKTAELTKESLGSSFSEQSMKKILIIEDKLETRQSIAAVLRFNNYEPISAENGRIGLEIARGERPDLILCDITMPELDGHEVLRALRADPALALIPFIFLTAKAEKEDLRNGMNLGADDYLSKPIDNDELVRAIETRLHRAAQQEKARRKFQPNFSSAEPLVKLGLTPRAAETLLWVAQGKTNADVATILGITESTVKKHMQEVFEKLGVETRGGAIARALEVLNLPMSN
jgi:DNA-binding NarL/FixJ family response regulator